MSAEAITRDFRHTVCEQVRIESEGTNRFRVFTPFMFSDGDHLAIILKKEAGRWTLSDEGHTLMHLTYELDEKDLREGNRAEDHHERPVGVHGGRPGRGAADPG